MANFYTDNPSLKHHLHHPLMKRIVELKERGYADKDTYDYAPIDFEDAMDRDVYKRQYHRYLQGRLRPSGLSLGFADPRATYQT